MQPTSRVGHDLRELVLRVTPRLQALDERAVGRPPAPGRWSHKQILGHLIDSAANNHQRFVRAADRPDLVFEGYDSDTWVERGRYAEAPWGELVELWRGFNLQLARVIDGVPEGLRHRATAAHSLDRIAFETVPAGRPATLEVLMRDYVVHLRHHLAQVLGELAS
jgi:hypothetical protein